MFKKQPYFLLALLLFIVTFFITGLIPNLQIGTLYLLIWMACLLIYFIYLIVFCIHIIKRKLSKHSSVENVKPNSTSISESNSVNIKKSSSAFTSESKSVTTSESGYSSTSISSTSISSASTIKYSTSTVASRNIGYGVQISVNSVKSIKHQKRKPIKNYYIHHLRRKLYDFVVVDIETTGLERDCKIIQLSALKIRHDKVIDEFDTYINPGEEHLPLPNKITTITGITSNMLEPAPTFNEVVSKFQTFVGKLPWVGHNINSFDIPRLVNNGLPTRDFSTIDTLKLAQKKLTMNHYGLANLKEYFGIQGKSHNSLEDCKTNAIVYQHLRDDILEPVNPDYSNVPQNLSGLQFAITGTFPNYSRTDIIQMIKSHGGIVKGISHKTDYLVDGKQTSERLTDGVHSSKELKARDYGIQFLSLSELQQLINNRGN